ncbi:integrase family protein [Galbibacter marinus]|uniref:Integrase family protein n=1 Tax=Galbibacter marinus TaxID=555500 RepID=K2PZL6_9FLAO|nr:site-specific integrase [Galbibacter marinus]EKF54076.1 integrase family protein [Galbibacter marinus]
MKNTFNVYFFLKTSGRKSNGQFPIYARVNINGKRADISTKRSTKIENWCRASGRLNSKTSNARSTNKYLDNVYAKILDAHKQLHMENGLITAQAVKSRYLGSDKKVTSLGDLIEYHSQYELPKLEKGTVKNYSATIKYLFRFIKNHFQGDDIKLQFIDYPFLVHFENYLRNCPPLRASQPLHHNGIMKHMERFQKFMNIATKFGYVRTNPFNLYELKFKPYESDFLELQELDRLKKLEIPEEGLRIVRDLFVFACYTGLAYIEVKLIKDKDIVVGVDGEDWINVRRKKTNTPVKVPLLKEAKRIIELYSIHPDIKNTSSLLPVYSNQKVNQYLKVIAQKAEIKKHLTFHVARHTFATTITLLNNVPLETVSKLLGHTKLSTTQRYARVVEKKISSDMNKLRGILNNAQSTTMVKATDYPHLKVIQ